MVLNVMYIGGVQWTSIIDFPGRVATTLFTVGCNFRCRYCQNRSLVIPDDYPDKNAFSLDEVADRLQKRKNLIQSLVITGGEPLMHKASITLFHRFKELGFQIKLDTNGAYPERLKTLLEEKIVDYVAMDYKAPLNRYSEVVRVPLAHKKISQSLDLLCGNQFTIPIEFRTTVAAPMVSLSDIRQISQDLRDRGAKRYYIQQVHTPNHPLVDPSLGITPCSRNALRELEKNDIQPFFMASGVRGL